MQQTTSREIKKIEPSKQAPGIPLDPKWVVVNLILRMLDPAALAKDLHFAVASQSSLIEDIIKEVEEIYLPHRGDQE